MPGHVELNPTKCSKNPNLATWNHEHPHSVSYPTRKEAPVLNAIAAVLKHVLGLPRAMLAADAALKYQVARSTLFLRVKDWRVGKFMLLTDNSNRSDAQMKLSPKAEEKIRDWALLHWQNNDTRASFQVRQFAALVAQNQE